MEHSWGKGIEGCTNKVPGVQNDLTLGVRPSTFHILNFFSRTA